LTPSRRAGKFAGRDRRRNGAVRGSSRRRRRRNAVVR
jgi:hypothetical protein